MSDSQTLEFINGNLDLYEFIQVQPNATDQELRTQYRRKALQYHPDKEGGDPDKFNLLSKVYEILVDEQLRNQYNEIRRIRREKHIEQEKLLASTRRFQEDLKQAENQHRYNLNRTGELKDFILKRRLAIDLEKLKEDGLKRRRLQEQGIHKKVEQSAPLYVSFKSLKLPRTYITSLETQKANGSIIVRWKHKPELKDMFNADVLQKIMEIFGPIQSSVILPSQDPKPRYDTGMIQYENDTDANKALCHNYKVSANLWDGTSVRKLASLLRECTLASQNQRASQIIDHSKLPRGFKYVGTNNEIVDSILDKFTLRSLDELS
ncbi:DnaJ-domain-containing protein [Suhomyces tanzawaensis NRRL Y-17324]|uniref:DnaJ-domain-containing protein n=1 Tax=Suhomyces tanzawaensis NRRL Y-17324 TaxID=984487 RepID=A0A1E4SCL4_9ASCO|nr:DnaJ-domain-containing protein [Suhomyces tanzawaensis NRRL Y-17324]ODV77233.1 DnaJ-domain-containing protein [Suhomyces tanzawaensis NRRL Y-17324]